MFLCKYYESFLNTDALKFKTREYIGKKTGTKINV